MKPLNWKELSRFNSVLLNLFTIIREVYTEMKIGIEIAGWLTGGGREIFVEKLGALGAEYLAAEPVRVIDENSILVNLNAPPRMPSSGPFTGIKSNTGGGWVKVEKRVDGLYVDGRKVILWISKRKGITGYELQGELSGKPVLHPNILDALLEHPHLIPEEWKEKGEGGYTRYIFFWGVVFFRHMNNLYVRQLFYSSGGKWGSVAKCLADGLPFDHYPVALLSSP